MKSNFLPTGLGYVYTWGDGPDDNLLTIEVSNLRSRGGSTLGLLTTSTTITGARTLPDSDTVLNAEVWLLSDTSRATYARALTQRIPTPEGAMRIDFDAVLEELVQRVLDFENSPVQVITLSPTTVKAPRAIAPDLVEGVIPAHKATILYGPGGVGKSILAAALAVCVQTGTRFLGFRTTQTEVLYLDWETDEQDIGLRLKAASAGLGIEMPEMKYASLVRPIEDKVAQLARQVAEDKIGFVIIDSVGMAMSAARDGGDASETAIRFFRALRSLDTAVLAIDHVAGEDMRRARGAAKPYGSVYKWNSARNAWELREREEPDDEGSHLLLKHRKSNVGPRLPDMAVLLRWEGEVATFSREKYHAPDLLPITDRIVDILSVAPANPRQLADLLSDVDSTVYEMDVRRALKELMAEKRVQAMADGSIRMVESTPLPE